MTLTHKIITIACLSVATLLTRFIPFILFPANKKVPRVITYLGKLLPAAVLAMLVVYCFKDYQSYDLPKTISTIVSSLVTAGLYLYRRSMLLPIAGGTIVYMLMVQFIF